MPRIYELTYGVPDPNFEDNAMKDKLGKERFRVQTDDAARKRLNKFCKKKGARPIRLTCIDATRVRMK